MGRPKDRQVHGYLSRWWQNAMVWDVWHAARGIGSGIARESTREVNHGASHGRTGEVQRSGSPQAARRQRRQEFRLFEDVQEDQLPLEGGWHPEGVHNLWRQGEISPRPNGGWRWGKK